MSADEEAHARYQELWERFRAGESIRPTLRPGRGRHQAAAVVVRVTDGALFRRIDRIRAAVAAFPFARAVPDHFLHLPVLTLGPVAGRGARPDEIGTGDLPLLTERARSLVADAPAFSVDVARVSASPTEVFAEVHPVAPLLELRDRLALLRPAGAPPLDQDDFLPRFPLAHFTAAGQSGQLAHALDWFHDRPIGRVRVAAVSVVVFRTRVLHWWLERSPDLPLGG